MDQQTITLLIGIVALLIALYCFYQLNLLRKKLTAQPVADNFNSRPLQLQAYERLVILTERLAIPNLISRINQPGLSSREMQLLLLENIKQEYEYNSSQQIYVSPVAWEAVKNLKEQNMLIINQVAAALPLTATGSELNKQLLEFIMTQKKGALHSIVLEALNFEARKVVR